MDLDLQRIRTLRDISTIIEMILKKFPDATIGEILLDVISPDALHSIDDEKLKDELALYMYVHTGKKW